PRAPGASVRSARFDRVRRWLPRADRRFAPVRQVTARFDQVVIDLGGDPTQIETDFAARYAFVMAKVTQMEEAALRGKEIERDLYLSLVAIAHKLGTTLGLKRRERELPTLAEYLEQDQPSDA